jgi:ligand-binding sensor domain-containing protein
MKRIKMRKSLLVIVLFLFVLNYTGYAVYPDFSTIVFSNITQKQGLSHNIVDCIFKDSDGFLWFGTRNGLCRYNGYDIKTFYSSSNSNSISGDRILSINEDKNGFIWIGTYANGLNKYNKTTEEFTHYGTEKSIGERINRIKTFKDGTLWICSSNGLAKYLPESDSFMVYFNDKNNPKSINSNIIYDITETRNGKIYVATETNAIQEFNPLTDEFVNIFYKRSPELNSNYRKRIVEDNSGVLWILQMFTDWFLMIRILNSRKYILRAKTNLRQMFYQAIWL